MNKICNYCKVEKDITYFNKTDQKNYRGYCKECQAKKDHERWLNINKEKREENKRRAGEWRKTNAYVVFKENLRRLREESKSPKVCIICNNKFRTNYKHQKCCSEKCSKLYYKTNRKYYVNQNRGYINTWARNNHFKYKENKSKRASVHYQQIKHIKLKNYKKRYKEDELFRLKEICRKRILCFLKSKGIKKKIRTMEMIGCDWVTLKIHIEKQFKEGMSWENHGEWHIDHKIPLCKANNEGEVLDLCNYKNLQPLWKMDNFIKNKY